MISKSLKTKSDDGCDSKSPQKFTTRPAYTHNIVIEVRIDSNAINKVDNDGTNDIIQLSKGNVNDSKNKTDCRGKLLGQILIHTQFDKTAIANHEIRE